MGRLPGFFRSLKSEWVPSLGYRSIPDARKDIGDYLMNHYNRQRPLKYCPGLVDHYKKAWPKYSGEQPSIGR